MCGIVGELNLSGKPPHLKTIRRMRDALVHRGPDDVGEFSDAACAFGFRRLAILDLSPNGHQPMCTADGRLTIIFNGEIYNYRELRETYVHDFPFQSSTDTEVIIALYAKLGIRFLEHLNGMWAMAIWDRQEQSLFIARDRLGVKPLYYTINNGRFVFASEIKAFWADPTIHKLPNLHAIHDYLAYALVDHTNDTFFRNILSLPAGHFAVIKRGQIHSQSYWDPIEQRHSSPPPSSALSLQRLLEDSIRIRLRSDVTLGSCLSGGIDSGLIVSFVNRLRSTSNEDARTDVQKVFTASFPGEEFDETEHARLVADANHVPQIIVRPNLQALPQEVERLIYAQDEPFGTLSIYAQYEVMRSANHHGLKVLLDGQGGDELFAGYHPYFGSLFASNLRRFHFLALWHNWRSFHSAFPKDRQFLHALLLFFLTGTATRLLSKTGWGAHPIAHPLAAYRRRLPLFTPTRNSLTNHLYTMLRSWSLPALLRYEDRDSMNFSIEARLPYLDFRLVEYAFSLPDNEKIDGATTKRQLRELANRLLPTPITRDKRKLGFEVPQASWLRGPLRPLFDAAFTLNPSSPWFDLELARRLWTEHRAGIRNHGAVLWRVYNLIVWQRQHFHS